MHYSCSAVATAAIQGIVGSITNDYFIGGAVAAAYFVGRKMAYAKLYWANTYADGDLKDVPLFVYLDRRAWTDISLLSIFAPIASVLITYGAFVELITNT